MTIRITQTPTTFSHGRLPAKRPLGPGTGCTSEADICPLWTFSTAPTLLSRNLFRSSSGFSRATRLAPHTLKRRARKAASPARAAAPPRSRSASPRSASILPCRFCSRQTGLLVGAVIERSHTPLSVWFWAAYLISSQTQGMLAVQFQQQLGHTRYETVFWHPA
jgi:hypothetical protein